MLSLVITVIPVVFGRSVHLPSEQEVMVTTAVESSVAVEVSGALVFSGVLVVSGALLSVESGQYVV